MAKTKTKIEKRLSKPEKVTNEELNKIQNIVNDMNRSQIELGGMEVQKHRVLHGIAGMQDQLTLFRDQLRKAYGTDDINIQTGKINYKENGEVDKKD